MKKTPKRKQPASHADKKGRAAAAPARETANQTIAPVAAAPPQTEVFGQAARLFQTGRFSEARRLFEAAMSGPSREMAHSARLHIRMCDQRLMRDAPVLSTAEDRYNYAVTLMNRRDFAAARQHLEEAVRISETGDHLHYALALCLGLLGDLDGAARHLRRAIEIQPRNRAMARGDPDFAELVRRPPVSELFSAFRMTPNTD